MIRLGAGEMHEAAAPRGIEILLCTEGGCILAEGAGETPLPRGESLLAPAGSGAYRLAAGGSGAVVYKASVPGP